MNNNLNNDFFKGTNNNEVNNTNNQPSLTDFFGVPQSSSQNNFSNSTNNNTISNRNNNNNNNIDEVNIYDTSIYNDNFQNNNSFQNNINNIQNVMINNTVNKSSSNSNIIIVIIIILVIVIVSINVFINKLSNTGNEVMEDAKYVSSMCIGSSCSIVFDNNGNSETYKLDEKYYDTIVLLEKYDKYIKLNLYHNKNNITDYKIILRSNGNEIDKASNEEELRKVRFNH